MNCQAQVRAYIAIIAARVGRIQNPGFTDYKIPTASELDFPIELDFVETDDPEGPVGAVGVWVHDLPITPEKVLAALRARAAAR